MGCRVGGPAGGSVVAAPDGTTQERLVPRRVVVGNLGYDVSFTRPKSFATNSRFQAALRAIERSNASLARGESGAYGRHVSVHLLQAEVPLHYLLNLRHRRFGKAVEMGVRDARAWATAEGLP